MNSTKAGRKVYCVITDQYGNSVTTNTATLKMKLSVSKQPAGISVINGYVANVPVVAHGEGLKYQWYYTSNGSSTTYMKSSCTAATYSTTMDASRAGRKVYCVITDKYGDSVTTKVATLKMKLSVSKQPTGISVINGYVANVPVVAHGEGLKYQWYYTSNGSSTTYMKSSCTSAIYSTTMDASRAGRKVYCVITDKYGDSVTTKVATIKMKLSISKQPTAVTVANGATAKTSVSATGEGLKYQWYYTSNGSSTTYMKSSCTSATYSTVMNASRAGRKVYCVITDKYGDSATTKVVTLKMKG